jgi:hypothetical protein
MIKIVAMGGGECPEARSLDHQGEVFRKPYISDTKKSWIYSAYETLEKSYVLV